MPSFLIPTTAAGCKKRTSVRVTTIPSPVVCGLADVGGRISIPYVPEPTNYSHRPREQRHVRDGSVTVFSNIVASYLSTYPRDHEYGMNDGTRGTCAPLP